MLSGKVTGEANTISVTADSGLDTALGFTQSLAARDAKYTVDGGAEKYVGLEHRHHGDPGRDAHASRASCRADASIVVGSPGPNTDAVSGKIQAFVDQYNSTVDFINSKLNEKKVVNPTTDDDRAKGVLNADPALQGLLAQLREAFGDTFTGAPPGLNQLSLVGVSTGATVGAGTLNQDAIDGQLTLDTRRSRALTSDFGEVKTLFTNARARTRPRASPSGSTAYQAVQAAERRLLSRRIAGGRRCRRPEADRPTSRARLAARADCARSSRRWRPRSRSRSRRVALAHGQFAASSSR